MNIAAIGVVPRKKKNSDVSQRKLNFQQNFSSQQKWLNFNLFPGDSFLFPKLSSTIYYVLPNSIDYIE